MRYHIMESRDIRKNLATEEYLMNHYAGNEPLLLLYIQEPCVIIGRNQNVYEEINQTYVQQKKITITRRTSGGGTVYDDLGNLSFSFVTKKDQTVFGEYKTVTSPIVQALKNMGATTVEASGRNDLYVDGMKFSGNAMYTKKNRLYSHGTLMYDVDLSVLDKILTVSKEKIESKATKSVRKSVTNIKPYLSPEFQYVQTEDFRDALLKELYHVTDLAEIEDKKLVLTSADKQKISELVNDRYGNDEWIYGETPVFTLTRRTRIPSIGIIDIRLATKKGKITDIRFFGDFFGQKNIRELEESLKGQPFLYESLKTKLNEVNISEYITHFSMEGLLDLLFGEVV